MLGGGMISLSAFIIQEKVKKSNIIFDFLTKILKRRIYRIWKPKTPLVGRRFACLSYALIGAGLWTKRSR